VVSQVSFNPHTRTLWRLRKRTGTKGGGRKINVRRAFRPIQADGNWPSSIVAIPVPTGATQINGPTVQQIYRPKQIRGGENFGFKAGNPYIGYPVRNSSNQVINITKNQNKVWFKFAIAGGGASVLSADTLEIMKFYGRGNPHPGAFDATLIARVY